jgi:hypothetical protein
VFALIAKKYLRIIQKTSTFLLTTLVNEDNISPCVWRGENAKSAETLGNRTELSARFLHERSDFKHLENWIL